MGSLLQLRELDLDERLQVKGSDTTSRSLSSSFKVVLGGVAAAGVAGGVAGGGVAAAGVAGGAATASLDHHLLGLLPSCLLDRLVPNLPQGRSFLHSSKVLLGLHSWGLQVLHGRSLQGFHGWALQGLHGWRLQGLQVRSF